MDDSVHRLIEWLQKSDRFVFSDKIQVSNIAGEGRGITLVHGEVRRNEIIISIPSDYQINFYTVLHHISIFNKKIGTGDDSDHTISEHTIDSQIDPRCKAYSIFTREFLVQLNSFQLISLYILIEWILLPDWSNGQIESFWKPFFDVLPNADDLKSIPTLWNCSKVIQRKNLIELLPASSRNHMDRISELVSTDWHMISSPLQELLSIFPSNGYDINSLYEKYLHIYFIINSRCLHANIDIKKEDPLSQFTLVPLVDFINHSDQMDTYCYPKINYMEKTNCGIGQFVIRGGPYTFKSKHEQILFSYGPHSNDFLLNEYGFTLETNQWDFIDISEVMCDAIVQDAKMVEYLKSNDYWGDYTINKEGISYRAFVAVSLYTTKDYSRIDKLIAGFISEDFFVPKIKQNVRNILQSQLDVFDEMMKKIDDLEPLDLNDFCIYNIKNIYRGYMNIVNNCMNVTC